MKRNILAIIALMFIAIFMTNLTPAFSADFMLDTKIKQVVTKDDKNGNEYTRLIIAESKELNGVKYTTDTVVMCFGDSVIKAKTLKAGDNLKAIVSENEYNGRTSYNLVAFVNQDSKKQ